MNEKELLWKYPTIFRQKELPMDQTAMCWGIECGKGWFHIIDTLCYHLTALTAHEDHPSVEFKQIKEKYGQLTIYYTDNVSRIQQELIEFAENLANVTCEHCGKPGELRDNGWLKTLCDECNDMK